MSGPAAGRGPRGRRPEDALRSPVGFWWAGHAGAARRARHRATDGAIDDSGPARLPDPSRDFDLGHRRSTASTARPRGAGAAPSRGTNPAVRAPNRRPVVAVELGAARKARIPLSARRRKPRPVGPARDHRQVGRPFQAGPPWRLVDASLNRRGACWTTKCRPSSRQPCQRPCWRVLRLGWWATASSSAARTGRAALVGYEVTRRAGIEGYPFSCGRRARSARPTARSGPHS